MFLAGENIWCDFAAENTASSDKNTVWWIIQFASFDCYSTIKSPSNHCDMLYDMTYDNFIAVQYDSEKVIIVN